MVGDQPGDGREFWGKRKAFWEAELARVVGDPATCLEFLEAIFAYRDGLRDHLRERLAVEVSVADGAPRCVEGRKMSATEREDAAMLFANWRVANSSCVAADLEMKRLGPEARPDDEAAALARAARMATEMLVQEAAAFAQLMDPGQLGDDARSALTATIAGVLEGRLNPKKNSRLRKALATTPGAQRGALRERLLGEILRTWSDRDRGRSLVENFHDLHTAVARGLAEDEPETTPRDAALVPEPLPTAEDRIAMKERLADLRAMARGALSRREFEVFELQMAGADDNQIAARLNIRPATLRVLRMRMVSKLGRLIRSA